MVQDTAPIQKTLERLSAREREVAELVVHGKSNRAIAEALFISERTVEKHVSSIFGKLNVRSRVELAGAVLRGAFEAGPDTARGLVPSNNLLIQTTSFVGRVAELAEINALLAKSRLVTITGTGGVGKTRVALQVGAEALNASGEGVWVADLAKTSGAESVIPEIARAFGVKSQGFRTLLDHVLAYLKHRRLLLILDNCEHVVAEASRVVETILRECPRVTVLATSRESLCVRGEQIYRLPSLEVPDPDAKPGAQDALRFGAVALFVDRAAAVDAHFLLTDETAPIAAEICRRLDGIALAIELAAARVTVLSVHQLLERLREQFRLFTSSDRAAPPRQQTMRATLDWSYNLLSEAEKTIFRRLAIFKGGCTIEAINAIDLDDSRDETSIIEQVSSLINKSLVTVEFRAQSQRYRLLEPVRQYGLHLLRESEEFPGSARCHARYFTKFAQEAASNWLKVPDVEWLEAIEEEIDNIRAALEWALSQGNDTLLGAELAAHLWAYGFSRHYHEARGWLEAAQAVVDYETHPRLAITLALARVRQSLVADLNMALPICEEAVPPARLLADLPLLVRTLFYYGGALTMAARFKEAEPVFNETVDLARQINDGYRLAYTLMFLGKIARRGGNVKLAREYSEQAAQVYNELRLPLERNRWLLFIEQAILEQQTGHLDPAIRLAREAYKVVQVTKDFASSVYVEQYLAYLTLLTGDAAQAFELGRSLVRLSQEELFPHATPAGLQILAGVATLRSSYEVAARLLGYAETKFRELPIPRDAYVEIDSDWFLGPLRDHFGQPGLVQLMAEGAAWSEDQAVEEGLKV